MSCVCEGAPLFRSSVSSRVSHLLSSLSSSSSSLPPPSPPARHPLIPRAAENESPSVSTIASLIAVNSLLGQQEVSPFPFPHPSFTSHSPSSLTQAAHGLLVASRKFSSNHSRLLPRPRAPPLVSSFNSVNSVVKEERPAETSPLRPRTSIGSSPSSSSPHFPHSQVPQRHVIAQVVRAQLR